MICYQETWRNIITDIAGKTALTGLILFTILVLMSGTDVLKSEKDKIDD